MKSIKNYNNIIIILLLFTLCLPSLAQTPAKDRFRITQNENEYYIEFIDTITKQVKNKFDIRKNNPFNNLVYPSAKEVKFEQPNSIYNFERIPINKIVLEGNRLILKESIQQNTTVKNLIGWSHYQAFVKNKYLIVHYLFYLTSNEIVYGRSDAVLIFNNQGNIIAELNNFDTNVREWAITSNGKYFSYAYGSSLDESLSPFCESGYKIIDIQQKKIIDEESFGIKYNEIRTRNDNNLIRITCFSLDNYYIFIDCVHGEKYSRIFTCQERDLWKEITDKGIIISVGNQNSGKTKLLNFKDEFKQKKIGYE